MRQENGSRPQSVKRKNRALVLRAVLRDGIRSRTEIAKSLNLTKAALSNLAGGLIADGILTENRTAPDGVSAKARTAPDGVPARTRTESSAGVGRRSVGLRLSLTAPVVCGVLIRRGELRVIVTDLSGQRLTERDYCYSGLIDPKDFRAELEDLFWDCRGSCYRPLVAVGIASAGPLDISAGTVSPEGMFTEPYTFRAVEFFERMTDRPAFLCNDATAGALAEKLFGSAGDEDSFAYISTLNGIGAGLYLDGKLYNGGVGQNGELGHMSVRFDGERCACGGRGCLELYADAERILRSDGTLRARFPESLLWDGSPLDFPTLLSAADRDDPLAQEVLTRYCRYLAVAVRNLCVTLSLSKVILAGLLIKERSVFADTLTRVLAEAPSAVCTPFEVAESGFGMDAPLYGSAGIVIDKIYSGELEPVVPHPDERKIRE